MILGVGIDVVHVYRLERWQNITGLMARFFHPDELKSSIPKGETGILSLAARFAAKEAFGKALGTGLRNINLRDIAVMNREDGKPVMNLYGSAAKAFASFGGRKIFVSLSHERRDALAVVIIEGEA